MLTAGHICFVLISPPGELTSIVCFMVAIGRLCFATKLDDMNEWDAPESNTIVAGANWQETYPVLCPWLAELPRWSYDWPCHAWNSTTLAASLGFLLWEW
jgi:hypothetical protein